jgi:competence protein ComEA
MHSKFLAFVLMCLLSTVSNAFEVNSASAFELESMRGIGQKMAEAIVTERNTNGIFKNWDDFKARIKGVGEQKLKNMQDNGLTLSANATQ